MNALKKEREKENRYQKNNYPELHMQNCTASLQQKFKRIIVFYTNIRTVETFYLLEKKKINFANLNCFKFIINARFNSTII